MSRLYRQAKMLCHAAEHLVYTFVPPRLIPTPDSVVYNDSIFNRDSQGSYVRTIFSRFAAEIHVGFCIFCICWVWRSVPGRWGNWIKIAVQTIATIESWGTYMWTFKIDSKTVSVFPISKIGTPISDLNTFSGENQKMFDSAQYITLWSISVLNSSYDMIPWGGHHAFKN